MAESSEDFDPSRNAAVTLMQHITEKGFQTGSCIATIIRLPLLAYRQRRAGFSTPAAFKAISRTTVVTTLVVGRRLPFRPVLSLMAMFMTLLSCKEIRAGRRIVSMIA